MLPETLSTSTFMSNEMPTTSQAWVGGMSSMNEKEKQRVKNWPAVPCGPWTMILVCISDSKEQCTPIVSQHLPRLGYGHY